MILALLYKLFIIILLFISLPLQCFISFLIVLFSGFPVLFIQTRIGKNGKPFIMYKFRTMIIGAENQQKQLGKRNEADGPVFKIHYDPRFTIIGKFLSHTGLDELPQLWNVLSGDMSLIGPRPLPVSEANRLTVWQKKRHQIKPGIISPWVLEGYHRKPFAQWMKSDIQYSMKKSLQYDGVLFLRIIPYMYKLVLHELLLVFS